MSKRILIFGLTGQDGAFLSKLCLDKDYEVFGSIQRGSSYKLDRLKYLDVIDHINLLNVDIRDLSSVLDAVQKSEPDFIVNFSANSFVHDSFSSPLSVLETNTQGGLNVLIAAEKLTRHAKIFQSSSSEVFGRPKDYPQLENHLIAPVNPYGVSKQALDSLNSIYSQTYNLQIYTGIFYNHESALRPREFVIKKIISRLVQWGSDDFKPLELGNFSTKRDWGYAPEYIKALEVLINKGQPGKYIFSTAKLYELRQILYWCCAYLGFEVTFSGEGRSEVCKHADTGEVIARTIDRFYIEDVSYNLVGNNEKLIKETGVSIDIHGKDLAYKLMEDEMALLKYI